MTISPTHLPDGPTVEAPGSPVCWGAIFAGGVAAVGLTLILMALGAGLGFSSVSPWSNNNPSATTFTIVAGIWLIVTQWLSAGIGGYLTGRLRTRWVNVHTHEVFFRDTAHGLVAWAAATAVVAGLLAAAGVSAIGGGAKLAAQATAESVKPYDVDQLLRRQSPDTAGNSDVHGEVTHILAKSVTGENMSQEDHDYLVHLVAARTGLSQDEAQKRIDQVTTQTRDAADKARKSAAAFSLFAAFSMLVGAFIAAAAGALGGSLRDEHHHV